MTDPQASRLVAVVLRCYPARWRQRHGEEAAELAALLIADGTPAGSIAVSFLAGAAREWLSPRPGRPVTAAACALLVAACALGVSTVLVAPPALARAAPAPTVEQCRPAPAPGLVLVTGRRPGSSWEWGAEHGRTC